MISLTAHLHPKARLRISSSTSRPLSRPPKKTHLTLIHFPYGFTKFHSLISTTPTGFPILAKNDNKDPNEMEENDDKSGGLGSDGGDGSWEENERSIFNSIRWGGLLPNPDPDNILAVGFIGLLTWACVQVPWQLLFILLAIIIAAVRYSLLTAPLIFILTLL